MPIAAIVPGSLRTRVLTVSPDMVTSLYGAQHMITRPSGVPAPLYGAERMIALPPDVAASLYGANRMRALTPDMTASLCGAVRRRGRNGRCCRNSGCRGCHRRGGRSRRIGGPPMMPAGQRSHGQRGKRTQTGDTQTNLLHKRLLLQKCFTRNKAAFLHGFGDPDFSLIISPVTDSVNGIPSAAPALSTVRPGKVESPLKAFTQNRPARETYRGQSPRRC